MNHDAATAYPSSFRGIHGGLAALKTFPSELGVREEVEVGSEKMLFEQLPALANEVARVEMVRYYAGD